MPASSSTGRDAGRAQVDPADDRHRVGRRPAWWRTPGTTRPCPGWRTPRRRMGRPPTPPRSALTWRTAASAPRRRSGNDPTGASSWLMQADDDRLAGEPAVEVGRARPAPAAVAARGEAERAPAPATIASRLVASHLVRTPAIVVHRRRVRRCVACVGRRLPGLPAPGAGHGRRVRGPRARAGARPPGVGGRQLRPRGDGDARHLRLRRAAARPRAVAGAGGERGGGGRPSGWWCTASSSARCGGRRPWPGWWRRWGCWRPSRRWPCCGSAPTAGRCRRCCPTGRSRVLGVDVPRDRLLLAAAGGRRRRRAVGALPLHPLRPGQPGHGRGPDGGGHARLVAGHGVGRQLGAGQRAGRAGRHPRRAPHRPRPGDDHAAGRPRPGRGPGRAADVVRGDGGRRPRPWGWPSRPCSSCRTTSRGSPGRACGRRCRWW